MREGSLDAPTRHVIAWQDPDFTDREKTEAEMRRIFDICHGCRRCFNLCDAFPRLFDLIDNSATGELDGVAVGRLPAGRRRLHAVRHVLHDEVPVRAAARVQSRFPACDAALPRGRAQRGAGPAGRAASSARPTATASWRASSRRWRIGRSDRAQHADPAAAGKGRRMSTATPRCRNTTAAPSSARAKRNAARRSIATPRPPAARRCSTPPVSSTTTIRASARRRRPCWRGTASRREVVYPGCCRMPQLEAGDLAKVAEAAHQVATALGPYIDEGYDIVALVPSCALMLKFEWPLIVPDDPAVAEAVGGDIRRRRIHRRHRPQGRAGARAASRSTAASRCISPATRGLRTWARRRPKCCA